MIEWLQLSDDRKRQILQQASAATGLPAHAIEKDWWVTLSLQALFSTKWKDNLVFKGGTSLSKAWRLIERFSEDIDLAIDREIIGFPEAFVSNTQVSKLRQKTSVFIAGPFRDELEQTLLTMGISQQYFQLTVEETETEDRDPQVLLLGYHSCLDNNPDDYIAERVLIEIGARSLREPSSSREIKTILKEVFPDQPFSGKPFKILTVEPKRTMLEKAFLLHEEFLKPEDKIRHLRLSRHLYDLEKLMDTEHCAAALNDDDFYHSIIEHRRNFTMIRGIDYSLHEYAYINFIPPEHIISKWESDYGAMRQNMIFGEALEFNQLIKRLKELRLRFRAKSVLNSGEIKEKIAELKIDTYKLAWLIETASAQIKFPFEPSDGTTAIIPVTTPIDIYQPAGENNKIETFYLHFKVEDENIIFVSIDNK
jgi:hypothetical protein